MKIIGAALGYRIDHAAHRVAVFRAEVVRDHLEFLNGLLRDLALDAGAAGVLVVILIRRVISIREEGVMTGDATETDQPEGTVRNDGRGQQNERVHASPVNREVQNLTLTRQL